MQALNKKINSVVTETGGVWGVCAKNLISGKIIFELNSNLPFPSASVGKIPIALYVFSLVDTGKISLDDRITLSQEVILGGSGVLQHLHRGLELTILDVLTLMLIVSDNTSAKMFVKKFTPQKINEYMDSLGFSTTKLKIDGDKFGYGMSTPAEMSVIFERLHSNKFFSEKLSKLFVGLLGHGDGNKTVKRYLPYDRYDDDSKLEIICKGGSIPGVRNSVGIVYEKDPYTFCVMSKDLPDKSYNVDNPGVLAIAKISKLIYEEALLKQ